MFIYYHHVFHIHKFKKVSLNYLEFKLVVSSSMYNTLSRTTFRLDCIFTRLNSDRASF